MMSTADIAGRLALHKRPRSWSGSCPACSYPRAFSLKDEKGRTLAYCANGCTQRSLAGALARVTGGGWIAPKSADQMSDDGADNLSGDAASRERSNAAARRIWAGSETATGTLADVYLTRRCLPHLAASPALRFRGDCTHPEGGRYPALIALVVDVAGVPIGVHRTYLSRTGGKAAADPQKASKGPVGGGAIRLAPAAPELVIGEGLESSASAGLLMGLPPWAAIFAGNLGWGVVLPPEVRSVVIAADADKSGMDAAAAAAKRWRAEGRQVRIERPDEPGTDFNDLLQSRGLVAHA